MKTEIIIAFIMSVMILLIKKINILTYCLKYLVFGLISVTATTVFIPLMLFKPFHPRNALLPAWGVRQISKIIGLEWKIIGKENIVQDKGTVVLMNHQSFLDLIVLAEIWPVFERCCVISKSEIFYMWPFGLAAWLWGTVFINRSNKKDAQTVINTISTTINTRKAKICMFPEGTRSGGAELLPFKKGAFHSAIAAQCPIQPLVITRYKFLDYKRYRFEPASLVISILPAIPTVGLKPENLEALLNKTQSLMQAEYDILNKDI